MTFFTDLHRIALTFACAAHAGHGRRMRSTAAELAITRHQEHWDSRQPIGVECLISGPITTPNRSGPIPGLQIVLQSLDPAIAWGFAWQGQKLVPTGHKVRSATTSQSRERLLQTETLSRLARCTDVDMRHLNSYEVGRAELESFPGVIQIDVENVRGASGFRIEHAGLLAAAAEWTATHRLQGRVLLVVDHGAAHQGFYLQTHGVGVVFAGPSQKADNVIAKNVRYFISEQDCGSLAVTSDHGLRLRCKGAASPSNRMRLVHALKFMESFYAAAKKTSPKFDMASLATKLQEVDSEREHSVRKSKKKGNANRIRKKLRGIRAQILQKGNISDVDVATLTEKDTDGLQFSAAMSLKETNALQATVRALHKAGIESARRRTVPSFIREKTSHREVLAEEFRCEFLQASDAIALGSIVGDRRPQTDALGDSEGRQDLSPVEKYIMWLNSGQIASRGESPEWFQLRRTRRVSPDTTHVKSTATDIEVLNEIPVSENVNSKVEKSPSEIQEAQHRRGDGPLGVRYIRLHAHGSNASQQDEGVPLPPKPPVRLVIVSDTHGMERSLTSVSARDEMTKNQGNAPMSGNGETMDHLVDQSEDLPLPECDILIHCGNFEHPAGYGYRSFDRWLAQQPASVRIVVRGSQDYKDANFSESNAIYIARLTTIKVRGISICVVPFRRSPLRQPLPECDVLVSHEPPRGVLDRSSAYSEQHLGSQFLKDAVCASVHKPRLWLCGHIHEGYGYESVKFGEPSSETATLVVNAASATIGPKQIDHAPTVIDIPRQPRLR